MFRLKYLAILMCFSLISIKSSAFGFLLYGVVPKVQQLMGVMPEKELDAISKHIGEIKLGGLSHASLTCLGKGRLMLTGDYSWHSGGKGEFEYYFSEKDSYGNTETKIRRLDITSKLRRSQSLNREIKAPNISSYLVGGDYDNPSEGEINEDLAGAEKLYLSLRRVCSKKHSPDQLNVKLGIELKNPRPINAYESPQDQFMAIDAKPTRPLLDN